MKKLVIALALATSSAPTAAWQVPPFVLRCAGEASPHFQPMTAKWDGTTLNVEGKAIGKPIRWTKPDSKGYDMRDPSGKGLGKGLGMVQLGFREQARPVVAEIPKVKQYGHATITFFMDEKGEILSTTLQTAEITDDILTAAQTRLSANCVTTLGP